MSPLTKAEQRTKNAQLLIANKLKQAAEKQQPLTLTGVECALLRGYINRQFNDGWKAGSEDAQAEADGEGW